MKYQSFNMRSFLSNPAFFRLYNCLIMGQYRPIVAQEYYRVKKGDRILDIGCGIGDVLEYLPEVDYLGFDMNQRYIDAAVKRFGHKGRFLCKKVSKETIKENSSFDLVIASGILHHLDNQDSIELFKLANSALKMRGVLVTIDGCYTDNQSRIVRYLLSRDRGLHVRTKEKYLSLAIKVFTDITVNIRHDLLRIPYTHIIMECKKCKES